MNSILKKNLMINLVVTLSTGILAFIVNKYFSFYLGVDKLGLMNLFTQLLAYISLVETGLGAASTYALYKPLAEKNYEKVSIIISTITSIYNKIFVLIIILGLLVNIVLPFFLNGVVFTKEIYIYWTLYVVSSGINYLYIKYIVLLTADQKFGIVRLVEGGTKISCQIIQLLVLVKFKSFVFYIIVRILCSLLEFIIYKIYYKREYKQIYKTNIRDKSIGKNIKNLFWHNIGGLFVFNTDLIIISKFISVDVVAVYASYQMISSTLSTILRIVFRVIEPMIGKYIAEHTTEESFKCWKILNILFLFVSIICTTCTYKLINSFIGLWMGEKFILQDLTVFLFCINLFINCFRNITDIFKQCFGYFSDVHLPFIEGMINLITSIILVQYMGLDGVIIGTIISNISIICIAKPLVVFKYCFKKSKMTYIKLYVNYLVISLVSVLLFNFISYFISYPGFINSWINWIKKAFIIFIISFISSLIVFMFNKDFKMNIILKMKDRKRNKNISK